VLLMLAWASPTLMAQRAATSRDALSITQFAALSARISDAGGEFDTDNLISNERSLLHPIATLESRGVRGGVYVGVGPDQNFSYIAATQPALAFIVDIRRDNLLHHLLIKALFSLARDRADFLALWLGRPREQAAALRAKSVDSLVAWAQRTPATPTSAAAARNAVQQQVTRFGIVLTARDLATIARFHDAFLSQGVALRFTSTGRAPREYYPTLGQLLAERDTRGRQRSYLASDSLFSVVQTLQQRNLIVPVVGDLSGAVLSRLRELLRERGEAVSLLYTSNVEDYLIRDGRFPLFVRGVQSLPRTGNAMVIRSWFGGPGSHPLNVSGYHTTQLVEPLADFVNDARVPSVRRYWELVTRIR
jgi:hypothetical protein